MNQNLEDVILDAAKAIKNASHVIAFTGAGISKESGIPTFRGDEESVWNRYDPEDLELNTFLSNPQKSWPSIKTCFYDFIAEHDIKPNKAHRVLANLEAQGILKAVITQNIDGLHQAAGSQNVFEFHGTLRTLSCLKCKKQFAANQVDLSPLVPTCPDCGGNLKPDFVFFGEGIPESAYTGSVEHASKADLCIVVGTSGSVMPAGMIPIMVSRHGGKVIEINPQKSDLTDLFSNIYIPLGAVDAFTAIEQALNKM